MFHFVHLCDLAPDSVLPVCTNLSELLLEGPEGWRPDLPWVAERQLPALERHGLHCQVPGEHKCFMAA